MGLADADRPRYGQRLLPVTIDHIAHYEPDRIWALFPEPPLAQSAYREVTFKQLATSINHLAWFIQDSFGNSSDFDTIAYLGKPDLRYFFVSMAAAKTGYKVLMSSHMNSLAAHLNLIHQTSCKLLLSAAGVDVSDILAAQPVRHTVIPELNILLNASGVQDFAFPKSFEEAKYDPYVVLHTSGSTGLPKPIAINHAMSVALDAQHEIPELDSKHDFHCLNWFKVFSGQCIMAFAPYHAIYTNFVFPLSVFGNLCPIFGSPDRLMSLSDVDRAFANGGIKAVHLPPYLLDEMVRSSMCLDHLTSLSHVLYTGGTLAPSTGTALMARGVNLYNSWGTTESGLNVMGVLPPEDWDWLSFHPTLNGIEWHVAAAEQTGQADDKRLVEMVMKRHGDIQKYQMIFAREPTLDEWWVGDLWEEHPTKPHTVRYCGRVDDLICFSNGLKLHPLGIEDQLNGHKHVRSAVVYGREHLQVVLLLELTDEAHRLCQAEGEDFVRRDLWRVIDNINIDTQKIATIPKTHVVFATRDNPFPRTSKGTIQRNAAIREYQVEIDEVYRRYGDRGPDMHSRMVMG